ncbi:inner membrane protein OXA1 [Diplocarpon rosae]|nr:inner membrane protein OXA1 [Diplocarpon rosae]
MSSDINPLTESSLSIPSDSEQYSGNDDRSPSPPSSASSPPMILYTPPSLWGLVRGAAINLLLPFINGLMLGFGELFAHEAAFRLGWGGTKFSSSPVQHTLSAHGVLSKNRTAISRSNSSLQFSRLNTLIRNGAAIRFASTTPVPVSSTHPVPVSPTPPVPVSSTTPVPASSTPSDFVPAPNSSPSDFTTSLDSATDLTSESLLNMPESIGYLKSLGLDFGYGPTSIMEFILEHVHVYAGTPWWLSITLTAILMRAVLFKGYINAAENATRMQVIAPITKPITTKMQEAAAAGNHELTMQLRAELSGINQRAGIKIFRSLVPLLQAFLGYGTFILLRAMSKIPVPGLETGGILWFYNLAVPDPYLFLPIATAGILHWVLRKGGEMSISNFRPVVHKAMMWGLPTLSIVFTWWLPAALQLSFMVTGILSFVQSTLFRQPWFRNYFSMTPLPRKLPPSTPTQSSPYQGQMRLAAKPMSTKELNRRFESSQTPKTGLIKGVVKEVRSTINGVVEAGREQMAGRIERSKAKRAKDEIAAYEARRRREIAAEELEAARRKLRGRNKKR